MNSEFAGALEELRKMTTATAARLVRWPDGGCCGGPGDSAPGQDGATTCLTANECRRMAQGLGQPLVALPHRGAVSLLLCLVCPLSGGEGLALQLGFAGRPRGRPLDERRLARLSLPLLMWAREGLERQAVEARLRELNEGSGFEMLASLKAQEEEREWLAYEVHDRLAQPLASAFQQLQTAEALARPTPEVRQLITRGAMLCRDTLREARNIMDELRPVGLEELGLARLLEQDARQLRDDAGCRVQTHVACEERPPRDVEIVAYRILREALANVRRHAQAQEVVVSLECSQEELRLQVQDNGVGFALAQALERKAVGGLMSMRRRAEMARGHLDLASQPGQGTAVSVRIPWPKRRQEDPIPVPAAEA